MVNTRLRVEIYQLFTQLGSLFITLPRLSCCLGSSYFDFLIQVSQVILDCWCLDSLPLPKALGTSWTYPLEMRVLDKIFQNRRLTNKQRLELFSFWMNLNPPPTLSPLIENVLHEEEKERRWNMQGARGKVKSQALDSSTIHCGAACMVSIHFKTKPNPKSTPLCIVYFNPSDVLNGTEWWHRFYKNISSTWSSSTENSDLVS